MAELSTEGIDRLIKATLADGDIYRLPDEVQDEILESAGNILVDYIQGQMSKSRYKVSHLSQNIIKQRKISRKGFPWINVTIDGTNDRGERNATVAFVLNYGRYTRGKPQYIPGEHFWTIGAQKALGDIPGRMEEIVTVYLQQILSKGA